LEAAEFLIEIADRCIGIANSGRQLVKELETMAAANDQAKRAHLATAGRDLANELEAVGQAMLAKAVELDTQRQKSDPGTFES
jgi:hypothetical protein